MQSVSRFAKWGEKRNRLLPLVLLVAAAVFGLQLNTSINTAAQAQPFVTRSVVNTAVFAGDNLAVTLTPSGVTDFFAAQENTDGLTVVSHTADAFEEGVLVNLAPVSLSYTLLIPMDAVPGQQFTISGTFWQDPGVEFSVSPGNTVLTVISPDASVDRSVSTATLGPGETATVTLTPTGISNFYAAREELDGLQLTGHDADSFVNGVFVRLGNSPIHYTVELPAQTSNGSTFEISGRFWEDPGHEHLMSPAGSQITAVLPVPELTRTVSSTVVSPGDGVTVTIEPQGISQFYAVDENLGGLQLLNHTADGFENGTFIQLTPDPFQYTLRIPFSATAGDAFGITGQFWEDPGVLWDVDPAVTTINVTGTAPQPSVTRIAGESSGESGDFIHYVLEPQGIDLFYAVAENFDGLELFAHTADNFDNGTFIKLTADPIDYTLRIPFDAPAGAEFNISGQFWQDPGIMGDVDPSITTVTVIGGPPSSVHRALSSSRALPGDTVTVTVTPTDVDLFYAVEENLGGLQLISYTADGFSDGSFIMLTPDPFEYTVRVPFGSQPGDRFEISGSFWEDPGSRKLIDPHVSTIEVPGLPFVERDLVSRRAMPGEEITITLTPSDVDLFYAVEEHLNGLELVSHDADNFESGVFIRLTSAPIHYTVRVPSDAQDGQVFEITGQSWEDPQSKRDVTPAITEIRVRTTPARVERYVENESIDPGDVVTVVITPEEIDLFYAVVENFGDLELLTHTADSFDNGAFVMLTPEPFEYQVRVPNDAVFGDSFPVSGVFWEDPGFEQSVSPAVTELFIGPVIGLFFNPDEAPLDIGESQWVEVHVDDLQGEDVDTVQLKIVHDLDVVTISAPSCVGIFNGGVASEVIRDESEEASWFNCSVVGGATDTSGSVMAFNVTRVGQGIPELSMIDGGPTGTNLFRLGESIDTPVRPLNSLAILPDTIVSGTVILQGVVGEQAFAVIGPEVTLIPISGGRETSATVNPDGNFAVRGVVDGIYNVQLDAPGSLGRLLVGLVVSGEDIVLETIELRSGLSNGDQIVAGADFSAVVGYFGLGPDDLEGRVAPGTELIVDFDGDGWITGFDISIVQSNMGETSFQEWLDPAVNGS